MALDIAYMREILPDMLAAAGLTTEISLLTLAITLPPAVGLTAAALLGPRPIGGAVRLYTHVSRGVPPLVQIAAVYFLLPRAGLLIDEFWTGVIALTLMGGGYVVAVLEGAILSIDKCQRESALALGLTEPRALFLVIAPQAFKRMLPPLANEVANLVKASALLSVISVKELTKVSRDLIFENFVVAEVMIEVAVLYLVIIGVLMALTQALERWARA